MSAWLNNILFAIVGGFLLFFRSRNRELPKPTIDNIRRIFSRGDDQTRTTSSTGGRELEFS